MPISEINRWTFPDLAHTPFVPEVVTYSSGSSVELTSSQRYVYCTAGSTATYTVAMPNVTECAGQVFTVMVSSNKNAAASYGITVKGTVGIYTGSSFTYTMYSTGMGLMAYSDGARWWILSIWSTS